MAGPKAKTVLIVEDDKETVRLLTIALERMKRLDVHSATNADEAIAFLEQQRPDLIILDIGLPGVSGWKLLDYIKKWCEEESISVIVTTAFSDPANRLIGKFNYVDVYLTKPFEITRLVEAINKLLGLETG